MSVQNNHGTFDSTKTEKCIEAQIVRFIHILRQGGLRIGTAEVIDALRALQEVNIAHKGEVKTALKATLVKSPEEREFFERSFSLFFVPPNEKERQQKEWRRRWEKRRQELTEAEDALTFKGEKLDLTDKEKITYTSLSDEKKGSIKNFIQQTETGKRVEKNFKPILESLVKSSLSYWYRHIKDQIEQSPQYTGDDELDVIINTAEAGQGKGGYSLLYEDMRLIAEKDLPHATEIIKKMARQMVLRISRRYRQSKKHCRLDFRRSIRDNIRFGGNLYSLKFKNKRLQKPRLLLLCDVSGSMTRYTTFVLQFIYGLNCVVDKIGSFIFSDNLEEITPYFREGGDFNHTMSKVVNQSKEWGGGTRLADAIRTLRIKYEDELRSNTIILVVSDCRTVKIDDASYELEKLNREVKEILWLNTLPLEEWENSHAVQQFKKNVSMFACNTLSDLEKVLDRKLFVK